MTDRMTFAEQLIVAKIKQHHILFRLLGVPTVGTLSVWGEQTAHMTKHRSQMIETLGLSPRVLRLMKAAGYEERPELEAVTYRNLRAIKGIGRRGAIEVVIGLAKHMIYVPYSGDEEKSEAADEIFLTITKLAEKLGMSTMDVLRSARDQGLGADYQY